MTTEHATCRNHPEAIAGWHCDTCKQPLCESCTASLLGQFSCSHCGETARQLTVPRTSKGFGHWLARALIYPLHHGLPLFAVMAVVFGGLPFMASIVESSPNQLDGVVAGARGALIVLYVLMVIDTTVRVSAESGRLVRLARLLIATSMVWIPAGAYVYFLGAPGKAALTDYAMWMYAALAMVYAPLALAVAATDISFADSSNPFKVFELGGRVVKPYVLTVIAVIVLTAAAASLGTAAIASLKHSVKAPVLGDIVAVIPLLAMITMVAHLIGLLTYVHGESFGWGVARHYHDPMFPHLVAKGRRKVAPKADAEDGEAKPATGRIVIPREERTEAANLADAIKNGNMQRALRLYEARTTWSAQSIEDRQLITLSQAAVRNKNTELAKRLLEDAIARKGRGAGQALLALAQLHGDVLAQPDKAAAIYRDVIARFPGSDVARIAGQKVASS
ncbi:MAG: hypothetical protein AB7O24_06185 [Kofleriaceae bacterium]